MDYLTLYMARVDRADDESSGRFVTDAYGDLLTARWQADALPVVSEYVNLFEMSVEEKKVA